MPSAHDSIHNHPIHDILLRIEINPPLPCGIDGCRRPAHCGRVELDAHCGSLWNLLPICEEHQISLAAAVANLTGDSRHSPPPGK